VRVGWTIAAWGLVKYCKKALDKKKKNHGKTDKRRDVERGESTTQKHLPKPGGLPTVPEGYVPRGGGTKRTNLER